MALISNVVTRSGRTLDSRFSAHLEGGPELAKALANLEKGLRDELLKEVTLAGAEVIAEAWRNRVPIHDGNYRQAIEAKSRAGKNGATGIVGVGAVPGVAKSQQPRWYAAVLEYGTSGSARARSGRGMGRRAAQPSARPAFDTSKDRAVAAAEAKLRELIAKATP
jgi:HK97 gp10 family phage protein